MRKIMLAVLALVLGAVVLMLMMPAGQRGVVISDGFVRSNGAAGMAGAAYFVIENESGSEDRLIGVYTAAAAHTELHTNIEDANGVMSMVPLEKGIVVPKGGSVVLKRGGDHVMLMGLTAPLLADSSVPLTLVFETAGEIVVELPVRVGR